MAIKVQRVNVAEVETGIEESLGDRTLLHCSFCGKGTTMSSVSRMMCEKLSRPHDLFCRFCLRNGLTSKNNRHTLMMTFRSAFSWLYYQNYKTKKRTMYFSQLRDIVDSHAEAGLINPAFKYDPESFLWFIDFEKVGSVGRKIPIDAVHWTIVNIFASFNFSETVPGFRMHKFFEKYEEAINTFYEQRTRPEGKRILCPTFQGCGLTEPKEFPFDKTRDFCPYDMVP